ncbi:MAG: gliding motility-associated C-terminal domain-containing protein [Flammeovirgaceae bacterium]|nr:MAG: gliding motility-associated C-terminal domain-containing protein [Flammeovirgaceae bacterium]
MAQVPNLEWAKNTAGPAYKESNGITIDPFGNVYIIGTFEGTADFDPGPGLFLLTSVVNSRDFFILKLDPNGHFVWAESFGGPDSDEGKAITTDAAGNVYVAGAFRGSANFDPDPSEPLLLNSFGNRDAFVAKYDDDGNLIWAKQLGGAEADYANDIKLDGLGNVLTTGYFGLLADFDPGTSVFPMTAVGFSDVFISKLNTNGDFIWAKSVGSPFYEYGYNIAVDPGENVLISGSFPGSVTIDFDPGPGNFMVTGSGSDNAFVLKLNPAGNFDWVVAYDGTGYSIGEQLAVDNTGNVIVSGPFDGTVDFDPLGSGFPLTAGPMGSLFITKLTPTGSFIWAGSMEGSGIVYYGDITVDVSNAIILAGNFENTVDFDPGPGTFNLTANGGADIFLVKLTDTGTFDWAGQLGAGGNLEFSYGVASDASGNSYVTGSFVGLLDADPSACVFNLAAIDDFDVFAIKVGTLPGCSPVITDFLPVSGPVGTVVVINGLNFSTTPADNIVEFNGTPAVVTASTTTSITTTVPPGATTGPISVTVSGLTGISSTDFTVTVGSCVPATERNALITLYSATDGSNWTDNTNWLSADEDTWFGVSVSGCHVTGIFLNNNGLSGSLPAALGDLTELESLQIINNPALTGSIPATIGNLTKLQTLLLHSNALSGSIPTSIGNLTLVTDLELQSNSLTGSIPATIGNMLSLTYLRLDDNQLSGSIPNTLYTIASLRSIDLGQNQLTGSLSPLIGSMPNLQSVFLGGNQLTGSIPSEIGNATTLNLVSLGPNQFTGTLPASIGNLNNLTSFSVFNNQLTGTVPATLANLTNLTVLGLSVNQFTGDVPAGIGLLPNLTDVSLRDNDFTSIPFFVSNSFTDLRVYGNKLHFGHLEPNMGKGGFVYAPQDNLPGGTVNTTVGQPLTIPFSTPGANNQYQWYKNGTPVAGATSATFTIASATLADAGSYHVEITNTVVTGLTLLTDPFIVTVSPVSPPVITPVPLSTQVEGLVTINLVPLITTSSTLDLSSLQIMIPPASGASASIDGNGILTIDYAGINFSGTDLLTIRACDILGNCTDQQFTVEVAGDIIPYNAVSPNGDGKNEFFYIRYIELFPDTQQNRVFIYNRWGDEVFSITNYDNDTRVFKGISNSGKELTTGTYFYKIEFISGRATKTGYLTLKK